MPQYILVGSKLNKAGKRIYYVLRHWKLLPSRPYIEGEIDYYVNRQGYEYENLDIYQKVYF